METTGIDIKAYLFLLQRRWNIVIPVFLAVLAAGVAYCLFWPPIYEASCLVVVQPQKVPGEIIKPTVTTKIEERLQIITQQVLSRTRLTEIIERFDLYPKLRGKTTPDDLAEKMRKDITIKISRKNYFTISFLYPDPQTVAAVTNALASFYVDSNLRLREQDAVGTARFLERELQRMRGQLTDWENKIANFKTQHLQELPESRAYNIKIMDQLRQSKMFMDSKRRSLRYYVQGYERDMRQIAQFIEQMNLRRKELARRGGSASGGGAAEGETDPEAIKAKVEKLRVFYTDDHPDIQRELRHLRKAEAMARFEKNKKAAQVAAEAKAKGIAPEQADAMAVDKQLEKQMMSIETIKKRIAQLNEQTAINERDIAKVDQQLQEVQKRIDNAPMVGEKLTELTRGYDELNNAQQQLYKKWLEAKMSANMERTQRGEQFEVVDPAQVPDTPFRPKIQRAIPLSVGIALALAVGIVFGLNYIDISFTSVAQLERLASLPVLVVMPPLYTYEEKSRVRWRNGLLGAIFALIFFFLLGLIGILVTGRGPALKRMLLGLFT
ncbi:MAG: hypothetical protein C4525_06585 [Desulfarculus sp.]|jgi:polysaccharide chain length determinant protein (PEP-CTERM system associated)|nr:MAG: hypothetical protein C4525_06585 [Desulfarculus sp.]